MHVSTVWSPYYAKNIAKVESVQTRMACALYLMIIDHKVLLLHMVQLNANLTPNNPRDLAFLSAPVQWQIQGGL